MEPQIRYARTADGVSIAYSVMGEGPPLVYASNVFGDLHWYNHNDATRYQVDALVASGWSVVRYDARGMGSSDRDVTDLSLDSRVVDLEAVVDHLALTRFPLCGYIHGGATSVLYSLRHPDRVSHLLLVNPYATGSVYYERIPAAHAVVGLIGMAEEQWEFYTLTLASAIGGFNDPAQARVLAALFRSSTSPAAYLSFTENARKTDLIEVLPKVAVPTLVVVDPSGTANADMSRAVAGRIPGARLVTTDDYPREIALFLGREPVPMQRPDGRGGTAVILFADIVDSTALTERMGDAAFHGRSAALHGSLRETLASSAGRVVEGRVLGDGVMAIFASAKDAIQAALRCHDAAQQLELQLHVSLHAGDVIHGENDVHGGTVNIAARVCALSAPGELLVSGTVRDLARTSAGVRFDDRGEHALKGVAEPMRVFAVIPA